MSRLTLPLFVHHEQGRGELPKDDREAIRLYEIAADQGPYSAILPPSKTLHASLVGHSGYGIWVWPIQLLTPTGPATKSSSPQLPTATTGRSW
jgi:TPR repeat protein